MGEGLANRAWRALRSAGSGGGEPSAPGAGLIASVVNAGIALAATVSNRATQAVGAAVSAVVKSATVDTKPAVSVTTSVASTAKPSVTPAVSVSGSNTVTAKASATPALALTPTASPTVKPAVTPAAAVTTRLVSGTAKATVNPAPGVTAVGRNSQTPCNPAPALTQIRFDLTHNKGGVTATTTGTWTTATNAQGDKNGTLATAAGEVTAQTKTLRLDYSDLVDKSSMTITAVRLIFYTRLTAALIGTTVTLAYSTNNASSWTDLEAFTADYDHLAAGRSYNLPLLTLAQIQAIQTRVTASLPAAGAAVSVAVDAIHLEVVANETWAV